MRRLGFVIWHDGPDSRVHLKFSLVFFFFLLVTTKDDSPSWLLRRTHTVHEGAVFKEAQVIGKWGQFAQDLWRSIKKKNTKDLLLQYEHVRLKQNPQVQRLTSYSPRRPWVEIRIWRDNRQKATFDSGRPHFRIAPPRARVHGVKMLKWQSGNAPPPPKKISTCKTMALVCHKSVSNQNPWFHQILL